MCVCVCVSLCVCVCVCVCLTFVHQLVEERHVGEEEEIGEHLGLDLWVDLVSLEEILTVLEHLRTGQDRGTGTDGWQWDLNMSVCECV